MKTFVPFVVIFSFIFILFSCKKHHHITHKNFYHWQSEFNISDSGKQRLKELNITRLYTRFFDVVWDKEANQPMPTSVVKFQSTMPYGIEIIPTIYIKNEVFLKLNDNAITKLSQNISHKINAMAVENKIPFTALQFDCDWTEKTSAKYFQFLKNITQLNPKKRLEATIRLHQVKYFIKTGVPPVNRGALMFYNMGEVSDFNTTNSIFDEKTAKEYLHNFDKYPLPLDVALPLYHWGVVFHNGVAVRLAYGLTNTDCSQNINLEKIAKNKYVAKCNTIVKNHRILQGEIIRLEVADAELSAQAAALISPYIKNDSLSVTIYHWDEKNIIHYSTPQIEKIFNALR
ncbi:MAG: hypothetical protein NTX03_10415 [Bacteroidetes bacterium]|nr:hypothetical protein [Bacteroidota bacterium]